MAVAGLILVIAAIALSTIGAWASWWLCVIALPMAIVGLCLSVSGRKKLKVAGRSCGVGTAGMVIGIIAVVVTAILFFTCGICAIADSTAESVFESALEDAIDQMY